MKCLGCGTENPDQARLCRVCGRPLKTLHDNLRARGELAGQVETPEKERAAPKRFTVQPTIDHRTIPDKIKLDYSHGIRDPTLKTLEGVQILLSHFQGSHMDIDKLLSEAAEFISRQFGIDNVAIGLRDPKDALYRYRAMVGFRGDALEAHKKIAYKKEQFFEDDEFHSVKISKYSRIYLAENNVLTEEERGAYNRPALLTMKLPDVTTIRWVEVIASIIAAALACSEAH